MNAATHGGGGVPLDRDKARVLARMLLRCEHGAAVPYYFAMPGVHETIVDGRLCLACSAMAVGSRPFLAPTLVRELAALVDSPDQAPPSALAFDDQGFAEQLAAVCTASTREAVRELPRSVHTLSALVVQLAELARALGDGRIAERLESGAETLAAFAARCENGRQP